VNNPAIICRQMAWRQPIRVVVFQPPPAPAICHVHFAVHRGCDGEPLLSLRGIPSVATELAEAEVAVGDERAHFAGFGECQRLVVVTFSVPGSARHGDVTHQAEGVGLVSTGAQPSGKLQALLGAAGCLVNSLGCKIRHTRAQKNESRPIVKLATTELLDGARNQRECLASPAVERMGGAESRGDERSQIGELPRATKIESAAQTLDRAREISLAKIGAPETE
jgi:hypothetical protein